MTGRVGAQRTVQVSVDETRCRAPEIWGWRAGACGRRVVRHLLTKLPSIEVAEYGQISLVDGAPLITTMQEVGYAVNWDATFWWPYIMMIAPTIAGPNNETVLWGSSFDKVTGFNNRLARVHVEASYAIRDAYYAQWQNLRGSVRFGWVARSTRRGGCCSARARPMDTRGLR
jgi:hypothetical protein